MLVLDDYKRHASDGDEAERSTTQVDIERFALLMFPTPPREGITPPRDAIILEAPQGAHLEFDDFRPELGRIGQITRGQFPGRITIRSDMHEPGPEDDLLIETADLQMNTKLLYTISPVRFRMGQNVGGGQELEIRFLADEHVQAERSGTEDRRHRFAGNSPRRADAAAARDGQLAAGREKADAKASARWSGGRSESVGEVIDASEAKLAAEKPPKPPVEVTCSGPFTFDFVRYVASLDRDVDLRQINPNGPSDQLVLQPAGHSFRAEAAAERRAAAGRRRSGQAATARFGPAGAGGDRRRRASGGRDVARAQRAGPRRSHSNCAPRAARADQRRQRRDAGLRSRTCCKRR